MLVCEESSRPGGDPAHHLMVQINLPLPPSATVLPTYSKASWQAMPLKVALVLLHHLKNSHLRVKGCQHTFSRDRQA